MGWYPEGRAVALKGLDYLLAKAKAPDGRPGFVYSLTPEGGVLDPLRDTYGHAFVLLALATVHGLDQDAQVRAEIDALLAIPRHRAALARMAASRRACRPRCRAGRTRRCICSRR